MKENREAARSREAKERKITVGLVENSIVRANEGMLESKVFERLKIDLLSNKTADYSRINLMQTFTVLGCNGRESATHWRVAKILDGISICGDEMKICDSIPPNDVPKIYQYLQNGQQDEKIWKINISGPTKEEKPFAGNISLVDFAYIVDLLNTNRNLGPYKIPQEHVVYYYLTGQEDKLSVKLGQEEEGAKTISILDQKINPKDEYKNINIESYLNLIRSTDVEIGLKMLNDWRFESEGHRELGGQAFVVPSLEDPQKMMYVPLSGRMAAKITLSDLQKTDKGGMMGQPQELGDMEEEKTGAIVRFRLADLAQRKKGGDIRSLDKTQRLSKAMVGMTMYEDSSRFIKNDVEVVSENKKEKRKVVYLCGEKLDGDIISGIQAHYKLTMKKMRGKELSKEEAADIAFTDVFVPCILNNENDWLSALDKTFQLGKKGAMSLVQNKTDFTDFALSITCRVPDSDPPSFEARVFKGMDELREYIKIRVRAGHIDQPGVAQRISQNIDTAQEKAGNENKEKNEYFLKKINDAQGKKIYGLLEHLLGEYFDDYLGEYMKKNDAVLLSVIDGKGERVKKGDAQQGQSTKTFRDIIAELLAKNIQKDESKTIEFLESIYDIDFRDPDNDIEYVASGLAATLDQLGSSEKNKIVK